MFPNYSSTFPKYIISKIYKELVQFNRKTEISVWKMSEEPENIFLKRRQQNEQQKYEKVFTITNYQGNTNSNHSILLHISHDCYKKIR